MHLVLNGTALLVLLLVIVILAMVMYRKGYRRGRSSVASPIEYRRLDRLFL